MKSLVFHHGGEILEIPTGVAWFPDGKSLGTRGQLEVNKTIQIRNAEGIFVKSLATNESVLSLSLSPNGKYLVSSTLCEDVSNKASNLKLWDANTGGSLRTFAQFSHKYFFNAIAYSRDGKLVASGDNYVQNNLRVWDVASGSLLHTFAGHQPATNAKPLSPLGGQLVSGGPDSLVIVWDLSTSVPSPTLKGHKQHVMSVVYTPDGQRIASGAADGSIR